MISPNVIVIPANPQLADSMIKRQLRVAAYCRVSTDDEEQITSYRHQKDYYTDKIMNNPEWTKPDFIASLDAYDLLIIDDLGVERSTEYAMEQVFYVVDSRYRSRKPMIITTNLRLEEIKNPPDLAHARIYDRILERCAPILFAGKNFREGNAEATRVSAKGIVSQNQN